MEQILQRLPVILDFIFTLFFSHAPCLFVIVNLLYCLLHQYTRTPVIPCNERYIFQLGLLYSPNVFLIFVVMCSDLRIAFGTNALIFLKSNTLLMLFCSQNSCQNELIKQTSILSKCLYFHLSEK